MKPAPHKVRLHERRRKAWSLKMGLYAALVVLVLGAVAYGSRMPEFTVTQVLVEGAVLVDGEAIKTKVKEELAGTYALLVPRAFSFTLPTGAIEDSVEQSFTQVATAKVGSRDRNTVVVRVEERVAVALWCLPGQGATTCYSMDKDGLLFNPGSAGNLRTYRGAVDGEPMGAVFLNNNFASLDAYITQAEVAVKKHITEVTVTADNDVFAKLDGGGEVRFVLAESNNATLNNMASVFGSNQFSPTRTLEYADFRFDNKAVVKFSE